MLRKLSNQARQAVKGRIEIKLDGIELGLSPEEVMADLNYGVGPTTETPLLVQEGRPEAESMKASREMNTTSIARARRVRKVYRGAALVKRGTQS